MTGFNLSLHLFTACYTPLLLHRHDEGDEILADHSHGYHQNRQCDPIVLDHDGHQLNQPHDNEDGDETLANHPYGYQQHCQRDPIVLDHHGQHETRLDLPLLLSGTSPSMTLLSPRSIPLVPLSKKKY